MTFTSMGARCGRVCRLLPGLAALALGAGCASLPAPTPNPESVAIADFSATPLARELAPALPSDGRSAFQLLPVASYSFLSRVELARKATRSLDVQYYILQQDQSGMALMRELAAAAQRGVRVRLLVDDFHSVGEDRILSDLNNLPNIEVRLFNPFVNGRSGEFTRLAGAVLEFGRVDRRMHNKLFIADNAAAVAGGRNVADEYFMQSPENNFVDLDVFVAGPAVRQLSGAFDRYWNSAAVLPIKRIVLPEPSAADAARDFAALTHDVQGPRPDDLPDPLKIWGTLPGEIRSGQYQHLVLAHAEVLADDPEKWRHVEDPHFATVTRGVLDMLAHAQHDVVIVSPYFVPGEPGLQMMREGTAKGGRILVVTNSLASTDSPFAQLGYMRYREEMLRIGVHIRELSPALARERRRFGGFGSSSVGLHAKTVLVDGQRIFIGSMNLDFRSAYTNTEDGLIIDSPALVQQLEQLVDQGSFYDLRLDGDGKPEWVAQTPHGEVVYHDDPETTWWQRLEPELFAPVVPDDEL